MANMKEIQDRMKSIRDTMKITNAMYMISSSKMKRAQKILKDTEPYFYSMQDAIARVLRHMPENVENKYFDQRTQIEPEKRKTGTIVITGDKGLAGAYNHNVLKMAEEKMKQPGEQKLYVLGELGRHYFSKKKANVDTTFRYTVQKPTIHRSRNIAERMISEFLSGKLDAVDIIYTRMDSAVWMEAEEMRLLPMKIKAFQGPEGLGELHNEVIAMSPCADDVLSSIIPNYLIGMIYGCLVESYSSEHNSRMTAMESSTKSAKEMLRELSIQYNRARQAAITQEITEVVSGANAQRRKYRS